MSKKDKTYCPFKPGIVCADHCELWMETEHCCSFKAIANFLYWMKEDQK